MSHGTLRAHPVLLIVLDGWGYSEATEFNAIHAAATPVWDGLWRDNPRLLIRCSGTDVGLPGGQMGNSEVGHMHIGAGRLIDQDFSRIGKAIASGEFARNPAFGAACAAAAASGHAVHILGLCSPGGVHSHEDHVLALLDLACMAHVQRVYLHAFLDGRDTPPQSAQATLDRLHLACAARPGARIASVTGRYYAMDRNQRWERIAPAYAAIVDGVAEHHAVDPVTALQAAYARGETDEFVRATVIGAGHRIEDGDVILFANFRADRARQLTSALTAAEFDGFVRARLPRLAAFVSMTSYGEQFDVAVAYPPIDLEHTFGAVVASHGLRQLRIAETEKYAHVTFFFNGGEERVFAGEERILVPSPHVATYDLAPAMSAEEVTTRLVDAIAARRYDAIVCNYANADMVGHTGDFAATVRCIEVLDACLGRVIAAARQHGVDVLITSDHGNAEKMRASADEDARRGLHTAHTSNLVPLIYVGRPARVARDGSLVDIAPTLLSLMGLPIPREMTGHILVTPRDSAQDAA